MHKFSISLGRSLLAAGLIAGSFSTFAEDAAVTLPETGVNVAGLATAAITGLGSIVAVVVAGTVAFYLVRMGLRWLKGIGGSR